MPAPQMYFVMARDADLPSRSRIAMFAVIAKNPDEAEEQALIAVNTDHPDFNWEIDTDQTKHFSNASEYAQRHATYLGA